MQIEFNGEKQNSFRGGIHTQIATEDVGEAV